MRRHIPNFLTSLRLAGAVLLLFLEPTTAFFSVFWLLYLFLGLTDMLDGYLARKWKAETPLGAMLDSLADLLFLICAIVRLLPVLPLSLGLWLWAAYIVVIKVLTQMIAVKRHGKVLFPHTFANKLTGFLLFVSVPFAVCCGLPLLLVPVAAVATFAAVQEGRFISRKENDAKLHNRQDGWL